MKYLIILVITLAINIPNIWGQNRPMPILENPTSSSVLSLGNTQSSLSSDISLYSNSTSFLKGSRNLSVSYELGIAATEKQNQSFHTTSIGFKDARNAFWAGFNYQELGNIKTFVDENMQEINRSSIKLEGLRLDFKYAHLFSDKWIGHIHTTYAIQKDFSTQKSWSIQLGLQYQDSLHILSKDIAYSVYTLANNIGGFTAYRKTEALSPTLSLGTTATLPIFARQYLSFVMQGNYLSSFRSLPSTISFGGGLQYNIHNKYKLNLGGYKEERYDYITGGASFTYSNLIFVASSKIPLQINLKNFYSLGIKYSF